MYHVGLYISKVMNTWGDFERHVNKMLGVVEQMRFLHHLHQRTFEVDLTKIENKKSKFKEFGKICIP